MADKTSDPSRRNVGRKVWRVLHLSPHAILGASPDGRSSLDQSGSEEWVVPVPSGHGHTPDPIPCDPMVLPPDDQQVDGVFLHECCLL